MCWAVETSWRCLTMMSRAAAIAPIGTVGYRSLAAAVAPIDTVGCRSLAASLAPIEAVGCRSLALLRGTAGIRLSLPALRGLPAEVCWLAELIDTAEPRSSLPVPALLSTRELCSLPRSLPALMGMLRLRSSLPTVVGKAVRRSESAQIGVIEPRSLLTCGVPSSPPELLNLAIRAVARSARAVAASALVLSCRS